MAAAVAFTMYQELPRVAFESARDKEQLLMDRGNQYKRAIQVFYAENKRYPAELKDLENTNDKRLPAPPLHRSDDRQGRMAPDPHQRQLPDRFAGDQKPPAQNASNGLPGAGQTPGGGPLGANNLNTAPPAPTPTRQRIRTDPAAVAAVPR